ncbi:MAG TPA: hypothetical protein DHV48_15800 [Prolixibacteraceae bacterium]|nr:hypothetical protein [Prolixibacteraceae bacterium]
MPSLLFMTSGFKNFKSKLFMNKFYQHPKFKDNGLFLLVENKRSSFPSPKLFSTALPKKMYHVLISLCLLLVSTLGFSQSANLDQARNGSATSPISPVNWVNGNVNAQQAHMVEGYSVPYRVIMQGLTAGVPVELDLEYDTRHSGANAIDFITSYDNLDPHDYWNHPPEVVNPIQGFSGMGTSQPIYITQPGAGNNSLATAGAYFDLFNSEKPGKNFMSIWGATPAAVNPFSYLIEQPLVGNTSSTRFRVKFTPTQSTVILAWGGHVARGLDWGAGNSAGGINGSPYHTRLIDWNLNNLGNQDRSMAAAVVLSGPTCDLIVLETPINASCFGTATGSITLDVTGSSTYTFAWTGPDGFASSNQNISGLKAGDYTILVTDDNNPNCTYSTIITIGEPAEVTVSAEATNVTCYGEADGTISVTASAGATVVIKDAEGNVVEGPAFGPGVYTITATNAGGNEGDICSDETTVEITEPAALVLELTALPENCEGTMDGSIEATFSGGTGTLMVSIDGADFMEQASPYTFPNLSAGLHTIVVKDANCELSKEITVELVPCVLECNTAFGYNPAGNSNTTCFLSDGFDRWGWTNKISPETSTTLDLYAGAAKCSISAEKLAGNVKVDYFAGTVTVTYTINAGYFMSEAHIYVGSTKYPMVKQGKQTIASVAPGQYSHVNATLTNATTYSYSFSGKSGDLYVIAHAVVCNYVQVVVEPELKKARITSELDAAPLKIYPNPFSDRAIFEFASAKDGRAVLEITNIVGQKIATLLDAQVKTGVMNRIEFQPRNITAGILIYRLILDGNVQTGRIIYKN